MQASKNGSLIVLTLALGVFCVDGLPIAEVEHLNVRTRATEETLLEVAEGAPVLSCHEKKDFSEKAACCTQALDKWRGKQALYADKQTAKAALLVAPEETPALKTAAEAAKSKYEASQTKRTYEQGIRECANSPNAYKLPTAAAATAARETADANYKEKAAEAKKAKQAAEEALQAQATNMAKYVKVAGGINRDTANANNAATKAQQAELNAASKTQQASVAKQAAATAEAATSNATQEAQAAKKKAKVTKVNLEQVQAEAAASLSALTEAVKKLKGVESVKVAAKSKAEAEVQAAKDAQSGATDAAAATNAVKTAQAALASAASATSEASAAVEAKEAEKTKFEQNNAAALKAAADHAAEAARTAKAAEVALTEKKAAQAATEMKAGAAEKKNAAAAAAAVDAKSNQASGDSKVSTAEADKASLQAKADAAAARAKEASQLSAVIGQQAAEAKHARTLAVAKEEQEQSAGVARNRDADAVKWDEQYESLKKKVTTVSDLYDKFAACVKGSTWEC